MQAGGCRFDPGHLHRVASGADGLQAGKRVSRIRCVKVAVKVEVPDLIIKRPVAGLTARRTLGKLPSPAPIINKWAEVVARISVL